MLRSPGCSSMIAGTFARMCEKVSVITALAASPALAASQVGGVTALAASQVGGVTGAGGVTGWRRHRSAASLGWYDSRSPGWHSSASQSLASVLNLIALA